MGDDYGGNGIITTWEGALQRTSGLSPHVADERPEEPQACGS